MSAIAGQTIDACADKEMRTDILRSTEQFIDVALTVADVNATLRITEKRRRLLQVF
ncbi:hypothetical protein IMCC9480_2187 [Oxalobacteraceae bacterium IMCC9480]|nr:hypothetical protein IMCC9480_2187 [Oxalobacteraceae bacterium IMCC9480]